MLHACGYLSLIAFQWFDIDMTSGEPMTSNPNGGDVLGSKEGPVPVIRLYGITREGQSVLACVHGFTPYMYASLPTSMNLNDQALAQLRMALDARVS
jgi:DNA polymerase delta subunit 1